MNNATGLPQRVTAALEFDQRINLHRFPVRVTLEAGMLALSGEVQDVAAKRIAARTARELAGNDCEVIDAFDVTPTRVLPDGDMLDALTRALLELPDGMRLPRHGSRRASARRSGEPGSALASTSRCRLRATGLRARYLEGGIDGWKAAGRPLVDKPGGGTP